MGLTMDRTFTSGGTECTQQSHHYMWLKRHYKDRGASPTDVDAMLGVHELRQYGMERELLLDLRRVADICSSDDKFTVMLQSEEGIFPLSVHPFSGVYDTIHNELGLGPDVCVKVFLDGQSIGENGGIWCDQGLEENARVTVRCFLPRRINKVSGWYYSGSESRQWPKAWAIHQISFHYSDGSTLDFGEKMETSDCHHACFHESRYTRGEFQLQAGEYLTAVDWKSRPADPLNCDEELWGYFLKCRTSTGREWEFGEDTGSCQYRQSFHCKPGNHVISIRAKPFRNDPGSSCHVFTSFEEDLIL